MERIRINNASQIPASFGPIRTARKKSLVKTRAITEHVEIETKDGNKLTGEPGIDLIVYTDSDPIGYVCKIDVFDQTYESVGNGYYGKKARNRLVKVPAGWQVELVTLETTKEPEVANAGDYIAVGGKNEVYRQTPEWVAANLEFES